MDFMMLLDIDVFTTLKEEMTITGDAATMVDNDVTTLSDLYNQMVVSTSLDITPMTTFLKDRIYIYRNNGLSEVYLEFINITEIFKLEPTTGKHPHGYNAFNGRRYPSVVEWNNSIGKLLENDYYIALITMYVHCNATIPGGVMYKCIQNHIPELTLNAIVKRKQLSRDSFALLLLKLHDVETAMFRVNTVRNLHQYLLKAKFVYRHEPWYNEVMKKYKKSKLLNISN